MVLYITIAAKIVLKNVKVTHFGMFPNKMDTAQIVYNYLTD